MLRTVHGHSIEQLTDMITSVLDMDGRIHLSTTLLDGWSSINILGYLDNEKSFVLKLPRHLEDSAFRNLHDVHLQVSQYGICPRPLYHGKLPSGSDLSILVLEYVEGQVYDSPFSIPQGDFMLLKRSLDKLATVRIRQIPDFSDALDHLDAITRSLELQIYDYGRNLTYRFNDLFARFITITDLCRIRLEGIDWVPVTVHGDLFERNVLFQEERAVLLDLEACCVSDRFFDYVYLFAQSSSERKPPPDHLSREGCSNEHWTDLEVLALCSVITWSLQHLLFLELGLVEANLSKMIPIRKVKEYAELKMHRLTSILESRA